MPSTHRLVMSLSNEHTGGNFRLVEEDELESLFEDGDQGSYSQGPLTQFCSKISTILK